MHAEKQRTCSVKTPAVLLTGRSGLMRSACRSCASRMRGWTAKETVLTPLLRVPTCFPMKRGSQSVSQRSSTALPHLPPC